MSEKNIDMTDRRAQRWHMDKTIPIAVIVTLVTYGLINMVAWYVFKSQVTVYMQNNDQKIAELVLAADRRNLEMRAYVNERTVDRITATQVRQMNKTTEVQINNVTNSVDRLNGSINLLNANLKEIWRALPRQESEGR